MPGFRYAVGVLGFIGEARGVFGELHLAYRPSERNLAVSFDLDPSGWVSDGEDPLAVFAGRLRVGYDAAGWAVGASVGVAYARINDDTRYAEGFGPAVGVYGRVGSLDGLFLMGRTELVLVEGRAAGGLIELVGQIPTAGPWVRIGFRGGSTGAAFFDLGVRFLLTHDAGRGAVFLTPTVGAGEVFDPIDAIEHVGILAGLTVEHRL